MNDYTQTPYHGAAQRLLERVAPITASATLPLCQIQQVARELLPATEVDRGTLAVLEIAEALTHVALFESADRHWLRMWNQRDNTAALVQWGYARAEAWRELAWMTALNAVEADHLCATAVA